MTILTENPERMPRTKPLECNRSEPDPNLIGSLTVVATTTTTTTVVAKAYLDLDWIWIEFYSFQCKYADNRTGQKASRTALTSVGIECVSWGYKTVLYDSYEKKMIMEKVGR